jgi:hypothetical protein
MEAYIDDMLVKSMTFEQYLQDLKKVFFVLHQHLIRLNPTKYVFSMNNGKFLGFLVNNKGIEPSLEKT